MIDSHTIKQLLERGTISIFISYAQKAFPNESCGIMCIKDDSIIIFPAHNIIGSLHNSSLTSRNSFMIDPKCWEMVKGNNLPVLGIYHSHTNGDPTFSDFDKQTLKWKDLYYLIIGIKDHNPTTATLFWWNEDLINEAPITI